MIRGNDIKRALGADVALSEPMRKAIELWEKMFENKAPWLDDTTKSLNLAASIAGEFARLITVEMQSEIQGSPRADFLQGEYKTAVLDHLREDLERAAAGGSLVFKPYLDGSGHIAVDAVPAWRFLPTRFSSRGEVTGAAFVEQLTRGRTHYTRVEHHELAGGVYTIRNAAFASSVRGELGAPCSLTAVEEWSALEPEVSIRYKDGSAVEGMLFAVFRIPSANNIDDGSPLGVSVYSRAADLIEEADKQYSRILWEYRGTELAIDASAGALKREENAWGMPTRDKRLFRELSLDRGSAGDLYEVFSPAIRDTSLFNGLDKLLKRIEFNCSLAYGTLSDPQSVEKTAEEIRTSKQRSYAAVCNMQAALQAALKHLVWVMDFYATAYQLAPRGSYDVSFNWGDGILEDSDKEYAVQKSLVDGGYLRPEKLLAWHFGVSEDVALREYMPAPASELTLE